MFAAVPSLIQLVTSAAALAPAVTPGSADPVPPVPEVARAVVRPPPIEVLYHADLDGSFAEPACGRRGVPAGGDYPHLLSVLAQARVEAMGRGAPAPLTLLGGNLIAPDLLGRVMLERPDAGGITKIAELLGRGGYDAIALGHNDLSLEPWRLHDLVAELAARALPVVATNLRCDGLRATLCKTVRSYVLVQRGGAKIGIVATISPSVLAGLTGTTRAGLTLTEPVSAMRDAIRHARAAGATWVVLMTQGPRDARGLQEIESLQGALAKARRQSKGQSQSDVPDLILAGGLEDDEGEGAIRLLRRDGAPPVVGTQAGVASISRVWYPEPDSGDSEPRAVALPVASDDGRMIAADSTADALLRPSIAFYCAHYAVPITWLGGKGPLSREAFIDYTLEVMRRRAGAEIALINRGLVKRTPFPVTGGLSEADLQRALPYRSVIGLARMTGGAIESTLGPALGNAKLAVAGLTRATGGLQVNGRPLDKARNYEVATISFVAAGGDAILPANALVFRHLDGDPDLRDSVAAFMRVSPPRTNQFPGAAPAGVLGAPPELRPLLVGLADVGIDIADTRIANAGGYGDAQLARADQVNLKGEATGLLQLRQPAHEADSRLNLKYGWTRTRPPGAPPVSSETTDLITFTTIYSYRGWQTRNTRPQVPTPYVRAGVESEFTRPDVSATQPRGYHHLELTFTTGALVALTGALKLRGGAGMRRELVANGDPAGQWRPVIEAGGTLSPIALATVGALAIKLEGLIDYAFVDPNGAREHQLRGSGKLSIPLLPRLFITAGLDVFAVQRQRQGWGASYDTTLGLRVHLDAARQWF